MIITNLCTFTSCCSSSRFTLHISVQTFVLQVLHLHFKLSFFLWFAVSKSRNLCYFLKAGDICKLQTKFCLEKYFICFFSKAYILPCLQYIHKNIDSTCCSTLQNQYSMCLCFLFSDILNKTEMNWKLSPHYANE